MFMRPTNIVFLMADQHTRHALNCYGNMDVHTPGLDSLAREGTVFRNAYCNSPICVPSRASLATGLYPHQIGAWDNSAPYRGTEAASWGHHLVANGNHVTTVGKLHYGRVQDDTGFADQRIPMHCRDGIGAVRHMLRERMPPSLARRRHVSEAGAGETEYTRYDRQIATLASDWIRSESIYYEEPWALFVSFVSPHYPLTVPEKYFDMYSPEQLSLPVQYDLDSWPDHPTLQLNRIQQCLEIPFDEWELRRAIAAYYGLVTFVDAQIKEVLAAVDAMGLRDSTRILYGSDHGEMMGEHGLWWKHTMFEASVGVPLLLCGPDVPAGKVVDTNVSLVDCFPTILECVGLSACDDKPGASLWSLARMDYIDRLVFSEYHDILSDGAIFMLRDGRYKYIHHQRHPPQLFDLRNDPDEVSDLGRDESLRDVRLLFERRLRAICDPEGVDAAARGSQESRLIEAGGVDAVLAAGEKQSYTPPPGQFQ
jgi:choline-sulfatase